MKRGKNLHASNMQMILPFYDLQDEMKESGSKSQGNAL